MSKYRKKPVVIEAFQFTGTSGASDNVQAVFDWMESLEGDENGPSTVVGDGGETYPNRDWLYIETLEGIHGATPGDWIIRGVQGEYYPCKPDIFDATYEPVEP